MDMTEFQDIIDYMNGNSIGFYDTDKAIDFVNSIRIMVFNEYNIDVLHLYPIFNALVRRGVDRTKFNIFNE